MIMEGRVIAGLLILAMAGCTTHMKTDNTVTNSASHAQIGAWGLDLASGDRSVAPGDDFYRYAAGKWLDANQIPPDRTSWGSFIELADRSERELHEIAEALPGGAPRGGAGRGAGGGGRAGRGTGAGEGR